MQQLMVAVALLLASAAGALAAGDAAACQARRGDVARQAQQFTGDTTIKRLIEADLDRAQRELIEGDAEECNDALDHATKLLSGNY